MFILILFRSVTYAQRGQRALQRQGIPAELRRAPLDHTERGCAYALRIPRRDKNRAEAALKAEGIDFGKVLIPSDGGEWEEDA